jgi:pyruvate dehydrogenase E1 component alpha subunit
MKEFLIGERVATQKEIDDADADTKRRTTEAVDFAENSPIPPRESMYDDIYV